MDNLTHLVADYAASLSFEDLPEEVVHAATQRVVDSLGCALGAFECDQARIGRRVASQPAVSGWNKGRILGIIQRSSADNAAFVNTAMIRNLDFNDAASGRGHPSDSLGALLAMVESASADGRRLLTSMVVAYEVFLHLSQAAQMRKRGWDQGYAMGIATVAGLGNLFGMSRDTIANAVAIVAVANLHLRATRAGKLSHWKGAATAWATRGAAFATLLAAEGMTGPDRPFEGRDGFWEKVTGPFELPPLGGRGGPFLTPTVKLKFWPVEGSAQPGVWAALELRSLVSVDDLSAIDIFMEWSGWREIGSEPEKWDPQTRETADHSLPYVFARTLVHGTIGIASFEESAYRDPTLRTLMSKIRVQVDDEIDAQWPDKVTMRVEATTRGGNRHTVEVVNPLGHPAKPMVDADIERKFRRLVEPLLGEQRTLLALGKWWDLPKLPDLSPALDLLQP